MFILALASAALLQVPQVGTDTLDAYNQREGVVRPAGTRIQTIDRTGTGYILSSIFSSARGTVTYDTVAFSEGDLKPQWHRVHAPTDSAAVTYENNRVYGYSHLAGGPRRIIDREVPSDVVVGDARMIEATDWSHGSRTWRFYDMWQDTVVSVTYRPLRRDSLIHHGRSVPVWVIQEDRGPGDAVRGQPFIRLLWIDPHRGKLLRRQDRPANAGPDDGYIMVAR